MSFRLRLSVQAFLCAVLLVFASSSRANQPAIRIHPVRDYCLVYLGDEGLQKELQLTPEQTKKLAALRLTLFEKFHWLEANKRHREPLDKAWDSVREILQPEQQKRLLQVIHQHLGRVPPGPAILASDPDFAKTLSLTDNQKKELKAFKPLKEVLIAEQKKTLDEVCGPAYPARLWMTGMQGNLYERLPGQLALLVIADFASELKLTEKQQQSLREVAGRWFDWMPALAWRSFGQVEKELVAEARKILEPGQLKRLDQFLQRTQSGNTALARAWEFPQIATALKISPEQKALLTKTLNARLGELPGLFGSGESPKEITKKVAAHQAETDKRLAALLTKEQVEAFDDFVGPPLKPYFINYTTNIRANLEQAPVPPRIFLFADALTRIADPVLLAELKPDEAGTKALQTLAKRFPPLPAEVGSDSEATRRARAREVEAEAAKILKPEQIRRWKEITYRRIANQGFGDFSIPSPRLVEVAEFQDELKLTPKQIQRFLALSSLESVLTPAQKETWKTMIGKPLPPGLSPPTSGMVVVPPITTTLAGGIAADQLGCLFLPEVQTALALSDTQKQQLREEAAKVRNSFPDRSESFTNSVAYRAKMDKRAAEVLQSVYKILDEKQALRLRQIIRHARISQFSGLLWALNEPEVLADAKLTPEELEKFKTLIREHTEIQNLTLRECMSRSALYYECQKTLSASYDKKVRELMDADGKNRMKILLGEPFKGRVYRQPTGFLP